MACELLEATPRPLGDFEGWRWTQCEDRRGSYEIVLRHHRRQVLPTPRRVIFTENEIQKLEKAYFQHYAAGTKHKNAMGALAAVRTELWPGGDFHHVAMKTVGFAVFLSYYGSPAVVENRLRMLLAWGGSLLSSGVTTGLLLYAGLKKNPNPRVAELLAKVAIGIAAATLGATRLKRWTSVNELVPRRESWTKWCLKRLTGKPNDDSGKNENDSKPADNSSLIGICDGPSTETGPASSGTAAPSAPVTTSAASDTTGMNAPAASSLSTPVGSPSSFAPPELHVDPKGPEELKKLAKQGGAVILNDAGDLGVLCANTDDKDPPQVRGVIVMPVQKWPLVYANTNGCVKMAKGERITKKKRDINHQAITAEKIWAKRFVREACGTNRGTKEALRKARALFATEKVQAWAASVAGVDDLRSSKWSWQRLEASLDQLYGDSDWYYQVKAAIKAEPMPHGKAPRILLADGDKGQLMALVVVCCFESLLFHHFEKASIKHASKKDAVKRLMTWMREMKPAKHGNRMQRKGVFEGDGSAWDTTCGKMIRDLLENPVLVHIGTVLVEYEFVPVGWIRAHEEVNQRETLKLTMPQKLEGMMKESIDSIRRSGHRGTSCLNYWINWSVWHIVIYGGRAVDFLCPSVDGAMDRWGKYRKARIGCEGDDSGGVTSPPLTDRAKEVEEIWYNLGFNMKLVWAETRFTMVGWHIGVDDDGPMPDRCAPELARAMTNSGVSCSPAVVQAWKDEASGEIAKMAGACALSRAYEFSGIYPTVSRKYLTYAEDCGVAPDRELSMRVGAEGGDVDVNGVKDDIERANALSGRDAELALMENLGFPTAFEELQEFEAYPWSYDNLQDKDGFVRSLPVSWRSA